MFIWDCRVLYKVYKLNRGYAMTLVGRRTSYKATQENKYFEESSKDLCIYFSLGSRECWL